MKKLKTLITFPLAILLISSSYAQTVPACTTALAGRKEVSSCVQQSKNCASWYRGSTCNYTKSPIICKNYLCSGQAPNCGEGALVECSK